MLYFWILKQMHLAAMTERQNLENLYFMCCLGFMLCEDRRILMVHWQQLCAELCLTDCRARLFFFSDDPSHLGKKVLWDPFVQLMTILLHVVLFEVKGFSCHCGADYYDPAICEKEFLFLVSCLQKRVSGPVLVKQYLFVMNIFTWSYATCGFSEAGA